MTEKKSPRELRKFGLTVGGAFLVLGSISWWRGHQYPPQVLWTLGTLLAVPGLLFPSILGPVERGWMKFAEKLGAFNAKVILTLAYYLIMMPVGLVLRMSRDPLNRKLDDGATSDWIRRERTPVDPNSYQHQF